MNLARDSLRTGLAIDAEPAFAPGGSLAAAMPQYTIGHLDRVATIRAATADHPGLPSPGTTCAESASPTASRRPTTRVAPFAATCR